MKKALITARLAEEGKAILEPILDIEYNGYGYHGKLMDDQEFLDKSRSVEVLVVELQEVTEAVIKAAKKLEVICSCRGTPNNVDIDAASSQGIPVLHAPGRNAISVAELVIGLIILLSSNTLPAINCLKNDQWESGQNSPFIKFRGKEIYNKTIGIIGFGAIGREVAKRSSALGMRVLVTDPFVSSEQVQDLGYHMVQFNELLNQSDFISLHVMPNKNTNNMIGSEELSKMKKSAYLINTASGKLVDEVALINCLRDGKIAGAGLDVFAFEPIEKDNPLLTLPNVVATPHIGGATFDVAIHQSVIIANGLKQFLSGLRPANIYNPEVLSA